MSSPFHTYDYNIPKFGDEMSSTPSDRFSGTSKVIRMDSLITPPLITPLITNRNQGEFISPTDPENDLKRAKRVGEFRQISSKDVCRVASSDLVLRVNEKHALERLSVTGIFEKTGKMEISSSSPLTFDV